MTAKLRSEFIESLARLSGQEVRRVKSARSRSFVEAGQGGALFLLRAGSLDREQRLTTAVSREDLRHLRSRKVSAIVFLCAAFGHVVVPARVLLPHLDRAKHRTVLHVHLGADGSLTLRDTGHDLRTYVGDDALARLLVGRPAEKTPELRHEGWQTVVGAIGRCRGYDVYVPAADRTRLDPSLAGDDVRTWTAVPTGAAALSTLRFADIVYTRPGEAWPRVVAEVEDGGNISDALARHAHTLAALREAGAPFLPVCVVVGAGRRRREWEEKLAAPLYGLAGLQERCEYWSFETAWRTYRTVRRRARRWRRQQQLLARRNRALPPKPGHVRSRGLGNR